MSIKTLAFSLLACAACTTAQATTTVLDNLSNTGNPSGLQPLSSTHSSIGQAFTVGTTTSLSLTDVIFPQIGVTANTYYSTETFVLDLVAPLTNTLTQVGTFTLDNDTTKAFGASGFAQTTAVPNGAMILVPGNTYMLVLSGASKVTWDYLNTGAYASSLNYSIPATNTTFVQDGSNAPVYYNLASGPQQFRLDVDAVPEPSTYCLMAVAGLFVVLRRKRSVKVA